MPSLSALLSASVLFTKRRLKLLPGWVQHFDLHLYDRLYDITSALGLADKVTFFAFFL